MNRNSFYSDRRKERRVDFLADLRVVSRYICKKHEVQRSEFEMLLKMHAMGTFLKADFDCAEAIFPWTKDRWGKMLKAGWLVRYRHRKPSQGRNYNIYTITEKSKVMVEECYSILCGEKAIPEAPRFNPIMKESTYTDIRYAEAIRLFNKARQNKE